MRFGLGTGLLVNSVNPLNAGGGAQTRANMMSVLPIGLGFTYKVVELSTHGPVLKTYYCPRSFRKGTLIVRPVKVGICSSDIKEVLGTRPNRRDFGHEIAGVVVWTNKPEVFLAGNRVCFDPHVAIERSSGFGTLVIANGSGKNLSKAFLKAPSGVPISKLVFVEPMACAYHCVFNLEKSIKPVALQSLKVAVIGAGIAGTLIGLILKHNGVVVTIINRDEKRLNFLKNKGIFIAQEMNSFKNISLGRFDAVIIVTSFVDEQTLSLAAMSIKPFGKIVIYGGTRPETIFPDTSIHIDQIRREEKRVVVIWRNKKIDLIGSYGAKTGDFLQVFKLLRKFPTIFPVERLITSEVTLEDLPKKLLELTRRASYGKTVVRINQNQSYLKSSF